MLQKIEIPQVTMTGHVTAFSVEELNVDINLTTADQQVETAVPKPLMCAALEVEEDCERDDLEDKLAEKLPMKVECILKGKDLISIRCL